MPEFDERAREAVKAQIQMEAKSLVGTFECVSDLADAAESAEKRNQIAEFLRRGTSDEIGLRVQALRKSIAERMEGYGVDDYWAPIAGVNEAMLDAVVGMIGQSEKK